MRSLRSGRYVKRASQCVLLFLLAGGVLVGGCSLFGQEDGYSLRLETDQDEYAADSSTTIQLTVRNTGKRAVHYTCTGSIFLEELNDGRVVTSWQMSGFAKCGPSPPINSGESKEFRISLLDTSPNGPRSGPKRAGLTEERYRLRMEIFGRDQLLDRKERVSNTFKITQ